MSAPNHETLSIW